MDRKNGRSKPGSLTLVWISSRRLRLFCRRLKVATCRLKGILEPHGKPHDVEGTFEDCRASGVDEHGAERSPSHNGPHRRNREPSHQEKGHRDQKKPFKRFRHSCQAPPIIRSAPLCTPIYLSPRAHVPTGQGSCFSREVVALPPTLRGCTLSQSGTSGPPGHPSSSQPVFRSARPRKNSTISNSPRSA